MQVRPLFVILVGLAGGAAFCVTVFLTFGLVGAGLDYNGILFNPTLQSPKVIAVWKQIQPLPVMVTDRFVILGGFVLFAIGHAFLYRSVAVAWPKGIANRALRLTVIIWVFSALFFEFMGPFNLLHEPLQLQSLEFIFWAAAALAESFTLVIVFERIVAKSADRSIAGATSAQAE